MALCHNCSLGKPHTLAFWITPLIPPHNPNCRLIPLQSEVSKLEAAAEAAAEVPEVSALSSAISKKQHQLAKLESRLNGIKDRLFADFRWGLYGFTGDIRSSGKRCVLLA